jgi:hypothetical protein
MIIKQFDMDTIDSITKWATAGDDDTEDVDSGRDIDDNAPVVEDVDDIHLEISEDAVDAEDEASELPKVAALGVTTGTGNTASSNSGHGRKYEPLDVKITIISSVIPWIEAANLCGLQMTNSASCFGPGLVFL